MAKKHFWKKIYYTVLIIFLLCLYGGVFGLGLLARGQALALEKQNVLARQGELARELTTGADRFGGDYRWAQMVQYENLARRAAGEGGAFAVIEDGALLFSSLPDEIAWPEEKLDGVAEGERLALTIKAEGNSYRMVMSRLDAHQPGYRLVYLEDVSALHQSWQRTILLYAVGCGVVSLFLAAGLYAVLRRLSRPLQRLDSVAQRYGEGDYALRLPVKGEDEIARLSASFNQLAESIQQNIASLEKTAQQKQELVDNLSHEIRTPVTAINGYAQYLQQAAITPEEAGRIGARIDEQGRRLMQMAARMLELASLRRETLERRAISAAALLRDVEQLMAAKAEGKEIKLVAEAEEGLVIMGDRVLLESLLANLADNAIKASRQGGRVRLKATKAEAGGCQITLCDEGCGMDSATLEQLGQPFFRGDKSRSRKEGGAGLGVALCMQIVALHGGSLSYHSAVGQGTRAEVLLPAEMGAV